MAAIESGWMKGRIEDEAFAYQRAVESGERVIVGVNRYPDAQDADVELQVVTQASEQAQIARLAGRLAAAGSTPKNSGAVTPTTVNGRLSIRMGWPASRAANLASGMREQVTLNPCRLRVHTEYLPLLRSTA